jgi:D-glucosaminate-6-phosphate ammonia-lyase
MGSKEGRGRMNSTYEQLAVRRVINANGTLTRMGGTIMHREVVEAMAKAANAFVRMEDLQEVAGRIISEATGAEAGYVSNGASGGLMMATAACVAGLDPNRMDRLPDTTGMKNEVIIQRPHRNSYDHAIRAVGVKIVDVGYLGFPGAGGVSPWQIEAAINERTAAIAFPIIESKGTVPLPDVVRIAHRHGVPVIVDAAASLPPVQNLRRFISHGADIVVYSGGKALRGPQVSGIIAGRRDLIESIALQQQDMDVMAETWTHRERYIESGTMTGPPHQGICRTCKVGKEEIVGLITALQLYLARDHEADLKLWMKKVQYFAEELGTLPHVRTEIFTPEHRPVPQLRLHLKETALGLTAADIVNLLLDGNPIIAVGQGLMRDGILVLNPMCLEDGEEATVVERLKGLLMIEQ